MSGNPSTSAVRRESSSDSGSEVAVDGAMPFANDDMGTIRAHRSVATATTGEGKNVTEMDVGHKTAGDEEQPREMGYAEVSDDVQKTQDEGLCR